MMWLPGGTAGTAVGMLSLVVAWSIALGSLFWLMPKLERSLDAR
jgi:hypothetical protein